MLEAAGSPDVERFSHGTTVATNALLERKGARTAFVATEGFEHLLAPATAEPRAPLPARRRPPRAARPARALPLRARADRAGRRRRARSTSRRCRDVDAEAIAVCLLFAFRDPSHEQRGGGRAATASSRRARRRLARGRARVPRVRARLDDGRRRLPRARRLAATFGRSAAMSRGRSPEPLVMRSSGRRRNNRRGGGASGGDPRLRAGGGGRRRGAGRVPWRASRT